MSPPSDPESLSSPRSTSALFSDELASYKGLDALYAHKVINHAVEYVRGTVHTNGIENFWSLLKRALGGTLRERRAVPQVGAALEQSARGQAITVPSVPTAEPLEAWASRLEGLLTPNANTEIH